MPRRSIMGNLFLMSDMMDLSRFCNMGFGVLSFEQVKAFDGLDHEYLFCFLQGLLIVVIQVFINFKRVGTLHSDLPGDTF